MKTASFRRKPYNTQLKTYEQREEVIIFAKDYGRKKALAKYNISLSTFKRWKREYYGSGRLDRRYAKQSRLETYPIQCTIIKQFLFDKKKWVQKTRGKNGCYGKGQWSKVYLINYLCKTIHPAVHPSTVYRIFDDVVKALQNPQDKPSIAWNYDKKIYKF